MTTDARSTQEPPVEVPVHCKYDERVARTYDEDRQVENHWWREDAFIKELTRSLAGKRVLDVPVGTGRFLHHYEASTEVVGIDASEDMLREARKRAEGASNITLELGDAFNIAHGPRSFDVVIVVRLLHLVAPGSLERLLAELTRVCRSELVIQTYASAPSRARSRVSRRLSWAWDKLKAGLLSPSEPARTPWSHISGHIHSQDQIDDLVAARGFRAVESVILDRYHGDLVRMGRYRRVE